MVVLGLSKGNAFIIEYRGPHSVQAVKGYPNLLEVGS
jgi:hypothetical protein